MYDINFEDEIENSDNFISPFEPKVVLMVMTFV